MANLIHSLRDLYQWYRVEHARVRALHDAGRIRIQDLADIDGATHQIAPPWRQLHRLY